MSEMKTYIGTKIINAQPMTRQAYNDFKGFTLPADENGADEGYLVEYTDGGKPNTEQYAGYVSWSPKEQFENAYRETSGLTFGLAIEAMKKGAKIARSGWNKSGQFVYYVPANSHLAQTGVAKAFFGYGALVPYRAYMALKTVDGSVATWSPSTSDSLAEDWFIVE